MTAALVLTALFNGAWQGALLCAAALVVLRNFRRLNASTVFVVWNVLLATALLLPLANYVFAPKPYTVTVNAAAPSTMVYVVRRDVHTVPSEDFAPAPRIHVSLPQPSLSERAVALDRIVSSNAVFVLIALGAMALLRLTILLRDLARMFAVRRSVRLIDAPVDLSDSIGRRFLYAASREMRSPCVIGFSPALIVIPEELLGEPMPVLKSIVLHEREHVRRFDDFQNLAQRMVGAIAFFLPGVVIALRELALYREKICDDAALNGTGDAVSYAMTLTGMAQWAVGRGTPMPTLIFKRRHLLHRLEVLLDTAVSHSPQTNRRFALSAAFALAVAALVVLRFQVPVIAQTVARAASPQLPVHASVTTRSHNRTAHASVTMAAARITHVDLLRAQKIAPSPRPAKHAARPAHPKPATPARVKSVPAAPRRSFFDLPRAVQSSDSTTAMDKAYSVAYSSDSSGTVQTVQPAVAPVAVVSTRITSVPAIAPVRVHVHTRQQLASDDLLDALRAQNMQDLSVDQLIALRDHGVSGMLVRSAASYFGHIGAQDLVYLADHGVGPLYIETLRSTGIRGISPADATLLMDHGVTARLIAAAYAYYNPHPSASDLTYLADHGVTSNCLESFRSNGVQASIGDTVRLLNHGVDGAFVRRVRALNPRASIDDIIRLRDSGF